MKIFLVILGLIIGPHALSQKKEMKFGVITSQEFEMTSYEKDKEAKAVILYDKGNSVFFDTEKGYDIRFTRHKRIKIFDRSESQHAEISIPYYVDGYGKTEVVKSIEAITYNNKNGMLVKKRLDPSTIFEEQINEHWFNKKFVFPDVQDGAILELRYVLETPFHFNLPDWTFQDKIPTIYSEYEVSMIPFYEYAFLVQGISSFDYQNSAIAQDIRTWGNVSKYYGKNVGSGIEFQDYVHTYVLKDVPAFKDESYISSLNDYIIKMDFQLAKFHSPRGVTSNIISTWPDLNKALLKHDDFGKYMRKASRQAKKILEEELELSGTDNNGKAKKIIEFIKNSFEWNGLNSKYASQSVKDLLEKGTGNTADLNLLLIALLKEADIDAEPVILSSRNHGKIPGDYPFDHFTNYVIALVKTSSPYFADGSENLLPHNWLPTRALNEIGLIVNNDNDPQWVSLRNARSSLERQMITLEIDSITLDAKTKVSILSTGYDSFINRKKFGEDTLKIREFYSDKIGAVERTKIYGYQNTSLPYSMNFLGDYETEKLGKSIVVRPFLNLPLSTNQLRQKERNYPLDFIYPWEEQFETTLLVPDNYSLNTFPESFKLNNDLAEINLDYTYADGVLIAKGNYKFKKAVYPPSEYKKIKQYFDKIVKHFNQPVILEVEK